jgi:hypothetical protein
LERFFVRDRSFDPKYVLLDDPKEDQQSRDDAEAACSNFRTQSRGQRNSGGSTPLS